MKKILLLLCFCLVSLWGFAKTNYERSNDGADSMNSTTMESTESTNAALVADITFCVDLSCVLPATAPSIAGTFNGWNFGANQVTDPDGDGIYCTTIAMPDGAQEYKFFTQEQAPEEFAAGDPCTVTTPDGVFTNRVINVVNGVAQTVTFGWESCDAVCAAPPVPNVELCVDMSCLPGVQAPSVFGAFNGWNAGANPVSDPDGDGIYCAMVIMDPGAQEFKFFDQLQGPEEFVAGEPCTVTTPDGVFTNRVVTVVDGVPLMATFGWNSCTAACVAPPPPPPAPDFPLITFDDPAIDYNLGSFGGVTAVIGVDPLDPTNAVVCATKPPASECWGGTTIGGACLENPVPFTPTDLTITVDVFSPAVGTPYVLKVEDCNNGAIAAEVYILTTVASAWETLVFDFTDACPAIDLNNTYQKISVFPEFVCGGNACGPLPGGPFPPLSGVVHYYDNITFAPEGSAAALAANDLCPAIV